MKSWWKIVILVTFSSWAASSHNFPVSIMSAHTRPLVSSLSPVRHMEVDNFNKDGKSILFSSDQGVFTAKSNETFNLVSDIPVESFTQISSHQIVFVHRVQHCLKIFNRITNRTKPFAGTCGTKGNKDGRIGEGLLNYPYGVAVNVGNPGFLLITDAGNQALRSVNIQTGMLSTVIKKGLNDPRDIVWDSDDLLVIHKYYHISRISWSEKGDATLHTLLGDPNQPGDLLGEFSAVRLGLQFNAARLQDKIYIVTDFSNQKLKIVDLEKKKVGLACFSKDVMSQSCKSPVKPVSLLLVGNVLYVGSTTAIFEIDVVGNITSVKSLILEQCDRVNVTLPLKVDQIRVEAELPSIDDSHIPEVSYKITKTIQSRICDYNVTVQVNHTATKRIDLQKCPKIISISQKNGHKTVKVRKPNGEVVEASHEYFSLTQRNSSQKCSYFVTMKAKVQNNAPTSDECKVNISASLADGQKRIKLRLPNGQESDFPAGVFTMKKSYIDYETCSYHIHVRGIDPPDQCPTRNVTAFLLPGENAANVVLPNGQSEKLGEGIHRLTKKYGSKFCYYDYIVKKSPIVRRLCFVSEYPLSCEVMNRTNFLGMLKLALMQRMKSIQQTCGNACTMASSRYLVYECQNDLLTIYWPTNYLYTVNIKEPSAARVNEVKEKLDDSYFIKNLGLFIPFHYPPVITAKRNSRGDYVQVILKSSCADKTERYDAATDTCS